VPESLHDFGDVFSKESFDTLPERRIWDHAIELERKDKLPTTRKVYPMSPEEQKELDAFLKEALSMGCIRPSKSLIGVLVFFVKKKDGNDDILIFTNSLEEHRHISQMVMECLWKHKLYLQWDKCEFVIISHNRIEMDPVKVTGVVEWPTPMNKKEVQSFLGFANFYRRFIANFSHHARPLFDLTKKDAEEGAFAKLKEIVTSAPILILPQVDRPFRIEADGSGVATGAVLSQVSPEDDKWHPVAFLSKSLSEVERHYEIHDLEMLAIIRALEEWRHYLEGARHPVEIWTDHKNLDYFQAAQKLNRRQAQWSLYLFPFDFTLHHKPGHSMGKPDTLLQQVDHGSGREDNKDVTLLGPDLFRIHALSGVDIIGEERDILREIRCGLCDHPQEEAVTKGPHAGLHSKCRMVGGKSPLDVQGEDLCPEG
jgi:hypothetical protein